MEVDYIGNDVLSRPYAIALDSHKVYLMTACPLPTGRIVGFNYYVDDLPEDIRVQLLIYEAVSISSASDEPRRYTLK